MTALAAKWSTWGPYLLSVLRIAAAFMFIQSGTMHVVHEDGTELDIGPGRAYEIQPGHDAWVIGDEACVMYDTGVAAYAKPQ